MAERPGERRRHARGTVLGMALLIVVALFACKKATPSRLLDTACNEGTCKTTGAERRTTGLTADSIGFQIGPGKGEVLIPIPMLNRPDDNAFDVTVLVQGTGTAQVTLRHTACTSGCGETSVALGTDYRWAIAGSGRIGSGSIDALEVSVATSDASSHADVLDLRLDTSHESEGCSVSGARRW